MTRFFRNKKRKSKIERLNIKTITMMSASQFIQESATVDYAKNGIGNSNICEFQTIPQDRPLVCHFSANDPEHFARAASLVEPYCDAIDLK